MKREQTSPSIFTSQALKKQGPLYFAGLALLAVAKYYYSKAGSHDLLWLLSPTARLVTALSGIVFTYIPRTGYVSHAYQFIIAGSCSGFQFMTIASAMLFFSFLPRMETRTKGAVWLGAAVMLSYIYQIRVLPGGAFTVWLVFICSWGCDTCAYCVGMLFGKHKLAPVLSPGKSVEGALGGIVGSALVGALYAYFLVEKVVSEQEVTWVFVLISAAGAVISQVGDLAASAIKRNHDIKDYGHLIPGHGGILDRFDSMLFTAPAIYFAVTFLR